MSTPILLLAVVMSTFALTWASIGLILRLTGH